MKLVLALTAFLFFTVNSSAQKITGIWRGYFSSSNGLYREGIQEEMYKYEIQIDQQPNNGIKGVTYSYKSTVFYGKATFQGIYNINSKTIILKETSLIDLKIGDKSEPCLMTCYLDYSKMGKLEVLQGTFISINAKDKGDCGSGKVYLERVPDSDFEKESFLTKKAIPKSTTPASKLTTPKSSVQKQNPLTSNIQTKPTPKTVLPNTTEKKQHLVQPKRIEQSPQTELSKKTDPIKHSEQVSKTEPHPKAAELAEQPHSKKEHIETQSREKKAVVVPKVLVDRENKLVKTIIVDEENIQVDLFDNGTIDNDTISVYHNNKQIIKQGRLAFNPISIKLKCTPEDKLHELVAVAENLGEIPPNTALMVITAGKKRYEVFLTSTENRNAKIVIEYIPKH
ncbi:hypothetical protein [Sediminibacterium sp.]|uniref:hypothetical protein n=1 Tax=Sediminibacterium sp. TaxID=1917865 RepID=UPI003F71AEA5